MTLDDFFTLTELNNGLTVPSRVKELLAVMQKERDCIVKNVGEATRQWSAVASAIAATENRDCLDLFVHLDGLHFIGKWLKDAQKLSNDSSDSFVEESITHLLQALERLHVDYEKIVATEMWTTVKDLLLHNNSKVQDKAQVLFESWKKKREGDTSLPDVENSGASIANEVGKGADTLESSQRDDSLSREISFRQKSHISTGDDPVSSTSSDAVKCKVENRQNSNKMLDEKVGNERPVDLVESSSLPTPAMMLTASHSNDATSVGSCDLDVSREDSSKDRLESASDINLTSKVENSPEKVGSLKSVNNSETGPSPSSSDAAVAMKPVTEPSPQKLSSAADKSLGNEVSLHTDQWKIDSDGKGSAGDSDSANQCRNSSAFPSEEGGEHHSLSKSSCNESWENNELGSLLSRTEDNGKIKTSDLLHASGGNLENGNKSAKKETCKEPDKACKKPDIEVYGIVDPLEVARKVVIEVEREVVDCREQSLSSSEKPAEGNVQQPDSPDSMSEKKSSPTEGENDQDLSAEASSVQELSATSTENLDTEQSNGTQDMDTSQVTEAAEEEINAEKRPCNFDLNNELSSEDDDHSGVRFSTPISIVSASRATAAPGLPVAPLQFEGTLGWKGSASTSAFRPASKQRQVFLDIDLNVGGNTTDGKTGDPSLDKNVPSHSSLSSVETNPRRSERLELDLNRTSEDGARPFFPQGNGDHCRSHSSSSSSKQPSVKYIDLNDQPSFLKESSTKSYLSQNLNLSGGIKSEDSVISIMGRRVEVSHKDFLSEVPHGKTTELPFDANLGKSAVGFLGIGSVLPYAHSSVYGYNNAPSGPGLGPTMGFSSSMYVPGGPIPYMTDSRGAPVIPQIIGSGSPFQTGYSQSPFFINTTNPNGVGAIGPSRSSFDDINSGTNVSGGSKDTVGFSQFLSLDRLRSVDEQLRPNSQPVISPVVGGKRKEPDSGWENNPFKHYTPPWK